MKIASNGTLQWTKTFGGVGDDYGSAVIQTNDGGYAVTARINSFGSGGFDFYLEKTDGNGANVLYNRIGHLSLVR